MSQLKIHTWRQTHEQKLLDTVPLDFLIKESFLSCYHVSPSLLFKVSCLYSIGNLKRNGNSGKQTKNYLAEMGNEILTLKHGRKNRGKDTIVCVVCQLLHMVQIFKIYCHLRIWMLSLVLRQERSPCFHSSGQSCQVKQRAQVWASERTGWLFPSAI